VGRDEEGKVLAPFFYPLHFTQVFYQAGKHEFTQFIDEKGFEGSWIRGFKVASIKIQMSSAGGGQMPNLNFVRRRRIVI
jgi:hypothetical protein